MLRVLAAVVLLATAPLTAAPILIDGSGYATGSGWGHAYLSGEGLYFSLALGTSSSGSYGYGTCRAGALCNIAFEGSGDASGPYGDTTEIMGTYLGRTITTDTFARARVLFHGSVMVHGFPYPSDNQYLNVPASADWSGLIQIWPDGPESAGVELNFTGYGPVQVSLDAYPNQLECADPPGGWTEQPPESCFATHFHVRGVDGTFKGTLGEVPEPSTRSEFGAAGLMALIVAVARNRKCLKVSRRSGCEHKSKELGCSAC